MIRGLVVFGLWIFLTSILLGSVSANSQDDNQMPDNWLGYYVLASKWNDGSNCKSNDWTDGNLLERSQSESQPVGFQLSLDRNQFRYLGVGLHVTCKIIEVERLRNPVRVNEWEPEYMGSWLRYGEPIYGVLRECTDEGTVGRHSAHLQQVNVGRRSLLLETDLRSNTTEVWARCDRDGSRQQTLWNHNGSSMRLEVDGATRKFLYERPRPGMLEVGVVPGDLLFEGKAIGNSYVGTAYYFSRQCGKISYTVKGPILEGGKRVRMSGQLPLLDRNCNVRGHRIDHLTFDLDPQ